MYGTFAVIQVIISVLMVLVILLQEGKKGMGAIFGGSSKTVFGAKGAGNILVKATTILAILFFINSIWLAHLSSGSDSYMKDVDGKAVMTEKKEDEKEDAAEKLAGDIAEEKSEEIEKKEETQEETEKEKVEKEEVESSQD
ncbi:MAG: preprotein translocase subunit SecG [bacterium]